MCDTCIHFKFDIADIVHITQKESAESSDINDQRLEFSMLFQDSSLRTHCRMLYKHRNVQLLGGPGNLISILIQMYCQVFTIIGFIT